MSSQFAQNTLLFALSSFAKATEDLSRILPVRNPGGRPGASNMPVITDKSRIDALLKRRVVDITVEASLRKKLLSGKVLRVKFGADPTSPDLHLGHAVPLKKLKEFQELGHKVVLIIGDYTAMVGDPSGKSKTRPMLTEKQCRENAETYVEQAGRILDMDKTEIRRNGEWFSEMGMGDVIRLCSNFTVARMIERDDFAKRLKERTDVHLHELLYPAMQAYDSIMVEADIEIGGSDQRFNILAGRDLQRKLGQPEQDCLFLGPILVGTDGVHKMSKSLGNYVGLADPPEEMCGKVMSIPDAILWDWFTLTTDIPESHIVAMRHACENGEMNPRDAKMVLAKDIVARYHSQEAADRAEAGFNNMFQKKETPEEMPELKLGAGSRKLVDILVAGKLCSSKADARRQIEQGGVRVAGKIVKDLAVIVDVTAGPVVIQKGKRHFLRVVGK